MSIENGPNFIPSTSGDDDVRRIPLEDYFDWDYPEVPVNLDDVELPPELEYPEPPAEALIPESTTHLQLLDLGPSDYRFDKNLGPETQEEEEAFADAGDLKYVERRESTGFHCIDDRVLKAGIQLPGGLMETLTASYYMNPGSVEIPQSRLHSNLVRKALKSGTSVWVHGDICAASLFKREGLLTTATYETSALEMTKEVMQGLGMPYVEDDATRAIRTGKERAEKDELWDLTSRESTSLSTKLSQNRILYEHFGEGHRAAGLRIDVSPHTFDNELFRMYHKIEGDEVGLLSFTPGAYAEQMRAWGYNEQRVNREVMHATLFTFGIAKAVGHGYLRAGIVNPKVG